MLRKMQKEQKEWSLKNFGHQPAWAPLLGAVEEIGELSHAHLKEYQGIRNKEQHDLAAQDAVADAIIYLMDYCNCRGWDMESILKSTWNSVKKRDWKENPDSAHNQE